jgi:hypothetical protein
VGGARTGQCTTEAQLESELDEFICLLVAAVKGVRNTTGHFDLPLIFEDNVHHSAHM